MDSQEIQKILEDERKRCEQHKNNYTLLKLENQKLQEEYIALQNETRQILIECNETKDASEKSVQLASKTINHKQMEIENLRQMLTENCPNVLRHSIKKEMESSMNNHLKELEEELEKTRSEHHKLRYDNALLKSQIESVELSQRRVLQETKMKHDFEIRTLREARDLLTRDLAKAIDPLENQRLKQLQKENNHLTAKVKSLNNELEDLERLKENAKEDNMNASQLASKLTMQQVAAIRALESEKSNLEVKLQAIKDEVHIQKTENSKLMAQSLLNKKEILQLRDKLQKCVYQYEMETSEAKIVNAHQKEEMEKEVEKTLAKLSCSELSLELMKENYQKLDQSNKEKENSYKSTINSLRNQEKDAKQTIFNMEKQLNDITEAKNVLNNKLQLKDSQLENLSKDLKETKAQLQTESKKLKLIDQAQKETENKLLQRQLDIDLLNEQLSKERKKLTESEKQQKELKEQTEQLKEEAKKLVDELSISKDQIVKDKNDMEKLLCENKSKFEQERNGLIYKIEKVEKQLTSDTELHQNNDNEFEKKLRKFNIIIMEQKENIEKLEKEKQELEKNIPSQMYQSLLEKFHKLQRQHQDFRIILKTIPQQPE